MQHVADNGNTPQNTRYSDDEIDLFELIENLWKEKLLIAIVTLVVSAIGCAYAFLATPSYKATIHLVSPVAANLKPLSSLTLYGEITQSPLNDLIKSIQSSDVRQSFIASASSTVKEQLYHGNSTLIEQQKTLNSHLTLNIADDKQKNSLFKYTLEFTAPTPGLASSELNRFVTNTVKELITKFSTEYTTAVNNESARIQERIKTLDETLKRNRKDEIQRLDEEHALKFKLLNDDLTAGEQEYKTKLQDKIRSLEEAYAIAKSLKIKEPSALNQFGKKPSGKVEVVADIRNQSDPLYLRGTQLLGAELSQLKSRPANYYPDPKIRDLEAQISQMEHNRKVEMLAVRKSDTPFSPELQKLITRSKILQSEHFPENLKLNFTASPAVSDPSPIKPKKALIIAISVILGGMLGVMIALIRTAVRNRNNRTISTSQAAMEDEIETISIFRHHNEKCTP